MGFGASFRRQILLGTLFLGMLGQVSLALGKASDWERAARVAEETEFLQSVVRAPDFNLHTLFAFGLIREVERGVYVFAEASSTMAHEVQAASVLFRATGHRILIFGNVPGLGEMPGADGIIFGEDGEPLLNLSLKSLTQRHSVGGLARYFIDRISGAARGLGDINSTPEAVVDQISPNGVERELRVAAVTRLLGMESGGIRPSAVSVDAFLEQNVRHHLRIDASQIFPTTDLHFSYRGVFHEDILRASTLFMRMSNSAQLEVVWLLFPERAFEVDRRELRIFAIPAENGSGRVQRPQRTFPLGPEEFGRNECEEYLTPATRIDL